MFGTLLTIILLVLRSTVTPNISLEVCFIPILMTCASMYGEALYRRKLINKYVEIGKELAKMQNEKKVNDISKKL